MIRHLLYGSGAVLLALPALLAATMVAGQDRTLPAADGPVSRLPAGPSPAELRARQPRGEFPPLRTAAEVQAFVDAAAAAPVARREEVRAIVARAQGNAAVADGLIRAFEAARQTDFSRALVVLSLLGEQRNPAGTAYLTRFLALPLPTGGVRDVESGLSPEAEAFERLQVKAANGLPYARTDQATRATLDVVRSHPLKAVRVEAASSYLWNAGNSPEARRTLSQVLRKEDQAVIDRPVRDQTTGADQFNRQLAIYLDRHPELRAPAPEPGGRTLPTPAERTPPQPNERTR